MKGTGRWLLKGKCRSFGREAEDYLARHPGPVSPLPARLAVHLAACRACTQRWQIALAGRELLAASRPHPGPAADPYFYDRVRARIDAMRPRLGLDVRWLHVALASALFVAALGSFAYNLHRTEVPNADEAIALDVPHINPQHPSDSHVRPGLSDAMLSLMNP